MSILQQLMEGDANCATNPEDIKIDPNTEKEIEESTMPIMMLIESAYYKVESDLYRAMEAYDLANIIGSTQVLQEGTNVQESASAVMEGNVKDFFGKIIEQLKKIKDWFVGIIRKILHKGKTDAKVAQEKTTKAMPEAKKKVAEAESKKGDEQKQIIYRGAVFVQKNGDPIYDKLLNGIEKSIMDLEDDVDKLVARIGSHEEKPKNLTLDDYAIKIAKDASINVKSMSELRSYLVNQYVTVIGDNDKPLVVTSSVLGTMNNVVSAATEIEKTCQKAINKYSGKIDSIRKRLESAQKTFESVSGGGSTATEIGKAVSQVNTLGTVYSQIVNTKVQAYTKAATAYAAFIDRLAKSGTTPSEATEGFNLSYMFESFDEAMAPMSYLTEAEESDGNEQIVTGEGFDGSILSQLGGFLSV